MKNTKINLVMGESGSGKSDYVINELIKRSIDNPEKKYIIVVPEQFTMETQREIVKKHPNGGVLNIDIVSFNRLAFRVFSELGINILTVLDDTGKALILRKIVEEEKDNLVIYKNKAGMTGFIQEIKSVISELYSYGIDVEDLEKISESVKEKPFIKGKLQDINIIYSSFKKRIREKYITKEEILLKLCDNLYKSEIIKECEIVFDGFTGFTPIQNRLLSLLMEFVSRMDIVITMSKEESSKIGEMGFTNIKEHELFNMSKNFVNKIFSMAGENNIKIHDVHIMDENGKRRHCMNKELDFLEKNIFRGSEDNLDIGENVKTIIFDDPSKESDYVASLIKTYINKNGLRFCDVAVITGDIEQYGSILATSLKNHKIPHFIDIKRELIKNPCVISIRSGLEIVDDDFSYESVFRFLKSDIGIFEKDEIDIFENYVLEFGIRGIKKYKSEFKRKKGRWNDENLEKVNEIRSRFIDLIEDFVTEIHREKVTVLHMTKALYEFTEKLHIYERLENYKERFEKENNLSLSKEYGQTYEIIIDIYDKMADLLGEEIISISEYRKILDSGIQDVKVGVIPLSMDTVIVGDIERTRLNNIKVLFVLGCNDGIIPKHGGGSGLLSQRDRGILKKLNMELAPTNRENIFIQKFYLYLNLTKPSDKLICSYCNSSTEGKSLRPSYLIGNLKSLSLNVDLMEKRPEVIKYTTEETALKVLARDFNSDSEKMDNCTKELFSFMYNNEKSLYRVKRIIEGKFFSTQPTTLTKEVSKQLYGNDIIKSVTRLEKYASCAYAHFISYGLNVSERKVYEISAADIGTIYHNVIEGFSKYVKDNDLDIRNIPEVLKQQIIDKCIDNIIENENNDIFTSTKRNAYFLDKIKEYSSKTIWAVTEHIKAGNFNPKEYEFDFREGRIDRIDTFENDGRLYVKIIDYKTGNKEFNNEEVLNGLQMQLVYYMGAIIDYEKVVNPEKSVMAGGAFYFNIKSPYVERTEISGDEDIKEKMLKEFKMTGIVNSDEEVINNMDNFIELGKKQSTIIPVKDKDINTGVGKYTLNTGNFTRLIDYVRKKAEIYTEEILMGNIDLNPYKKGQISPCNYCNFNGICNFNEKFSNNRYRKLKKYTSEDIYNEIYDIEKGEGDENGR